MNVWIYYTLETTDFDKQIFKPNLRQRNTHTRKDLLFLFITRNVFIFYGDDLHGGDDLHDVDDDDDCCDDDDDDYHQKVLHQLQHLQPFQEVQHQLPFHHPSKDIFIRRKLSITEVNYPWPFFNYHSWLVLTKTLKKYKKVSHLKKVTLGLSSIITV